MIPVRHGGRPLDFRIRVLLDVGTSKASSKPKESLKKGNVSLDDFDFIFDVEGTSFRPGTSCTHWAACFHQNL